jgi:hypothetical protein
MSRIAAYRHYAAECLQWAERATNPSERHLFIEMASGWHEMATLLTDYMEAHDDGEKVPFEDLIKLAENKRQAN